MRLNAGQRRKVEENVGLVHKVIADKVRGPFPVGIHTREDLFQTGCIGLCKAAATDRGGTFSTYAYRLIWHEICDVLARSYREREIPSDWLVTGGVIFPVHLQTEAVQELKMDLGSVLSEAEKAAPQTVGKGIRSILLMQQGYTCREIGVQMGAGANHVSAWASKARRFLKGRKGLVELAEEFGYGKG